MTSILTFDFGTTYFKAALFDAREGALRALARRPAPVSRPCSGWCEMEVSQFQESVAALLHGLRENAGAKLQDVASICFSTQTNSFLLWDAGERPLTPFILWPDNRNQGCEEQLQELLADLPLQNRTGVTDVSHQFMLAKLLWLQSQMPNLWRRARRISLLGDYFTWWLSGRHVTEAGAAGLTALLDIHDLHWWEDACGRFGVTPEWLPKISRAGTDLGRIDPQAADALGLPASCRIYLGCLDQYAGAVGAGNVASGGLSETTGTVLATVRCSDRFRENWETAFQGPAAQSGRYYQMCFGDTSANLLEAFKNSLPRQCSFSMLDEFAADVQPGADGLRIHPGPAPDDIRDLFIGLDSRHGLGHQTRAILEGVAYALHGQIQSLTGSEGADALRSAGGAARSELWLQIKADVLGIPVSATACPEPACLGAAILAAAAMENENLETVAGQWATTRPPYLPDPERVRLYQNLRGDQ